MNMKEIIKLAQDGRPELAAINAVATGRFRLAAYVARFPHASGVKFSARELVYAGRSATRYYSRED